MSCGTEFGSECAKLTKGGVPTDIASRLVAVDSGNLSDGIEAKPP